MIDKLLWLLQSVSNSVLSLHLDSAILKEILDILIPFLLLTVLIVLLLFFFLDDFGLRLPSEVPLLGQRLNKLDSWSWNLAFQLVLQIFLRNESLCKGVSLLLNLQFVESLLFNSLDLLPHP